MKSLICSVLVVSIYWTLCSFDDYTPVNCKVTNSSTFSFSSSIKCDDHPGNNTVYYGWAIQYDHEHLVPFYKCFSNETVAQTKALEAHPIGQEENDICVKLKNPGYITTLFKIQKVCSERQNNFIVFFGVLGFCLFIIF